MTVWYENVRFYFTNPSTSEATTVLGYHYESLRSWLHIFYLSVSLYPEVKGWMEAYVRRWETEVNQLGGMMSVDAFQPASNWKSFPKNQVLKKVEWKNGKVTEEASSDEGNQCTMWSEFILIIRLDTNNAAFIW